MAGNVSFKILIASEGFERFDVIIRPQILVAPAVRQLTLGSGRAASGYNQGRNGVAASSSLRMENHK